MQYFYGPDSYGAREAIGELAQRTKTAIQWIDREQLDERNISDLVGQSHSLFGNELAVVRDPSALPKNQQDDIAAYVEGEGKTRLWALWDAGAPDKRSKVWRALKSQGREFPSLALPELAMWLITRAEQLGGAIGKPAAQALVARLGSDRWRLENELKRLLLMTREGKGVGLALVEREISVVESAEMFATLDALARGEQATALKSIETLLAAGHSEFYVVSMLGYQWRTLLMVRAGLAAGQALAAIAREGRLHPYVVEKNTPVARRLSVTQWRDGLTRILASDFAMKQGRVDPRTGLLLLALTLSRSLSG